MRRRDGLPLCKRRSPSRQLGEAAARAPENDAGKTADIPSSNASSKAAQDRVFIDRFGKKHSEAVLRNWSPQMQRVMRIRCAEADLKAEIASNEKELAALGCTPEDIKNHNAPRERELRQLEQGNGPAPVKKHRRACCDRDDDDQPAVVDTSLSNILSTPSGKRRPSPKAPSAHACGAVAAVVEIQTSRDLPALAAEINNYHAAVLEAYGSAVEHAIKAGEKLGIAKDLAGHGKWLPWLCENCPELSERTAQLYMQVARHKDELKSATVADLSLRRAVKALAKPKAKTSPKAEPEPAAVEQKELSAPFESAEESTVEPEILESGADGSESPIETLERREPAAEDAGQRDASAESESAKPMSAVIEYSRLQYSDPEREREAHGRNLRCLDKAREDYLELCDLLEVDLEVEEERIVDALRAIARARQVDADHRVYEGEVASTSTEARVDPWADLDIPPELRRKPSRG